MFAFLAFSPSCFAQFEGFSDDAGTENQGSNTSNQSGQMAAQDTTKSDGPVHVFEVPELPEGEGDINENSVRPIHASDQMFKKGVWRRIALEEKQNRPFFSQGKEITRVIIEAVQRGDVTPYANDSLTTPLTINEFMENMVMSREDNMSGGGGFDDFGGFGDDAPADDAGDEASEPAQLTNYYFPRQLTTLELQEDMIFDKQRSRLYYDIQSISIIVPAAQTTTGLERRLASFSYKELVENVFSKDPRAIWFNSQNSAEHKSFPEAFDLRLFSSRITKVANPDGSPLTDIYSDPKKALMASQWAEEELIEFEHNLWEY